MNNLIIGAINKSIGNKEYQLHNINELIYILKKDNLNIVEKYYLKELFSIPAPILKEKLLKILNDKEKELFFQKAQELCLFNENIKTLISLF
jgi:hypothetical protein